MLFHQALVKACPAPVHPLKGVTSSNVPTSSSDPRALEATICQEPTGDSSDMMRSSHQSGRGNAPTVFTSFLVCTLLATVAGQTTGEDGKIVLMS